MESDERPDARHPSNHPVTRSPYKRSIRTRIVLTILVLSAGISAAVMISLPSSIRVEEVHAAVQTAQGLATDVAENYPDHSKGEKFAESFLLHNRGVSYLVVEDSAGRIVYGLGRALADEADYRSTPLEGTHDATHHLVKVRATWTAANDSTGTIYLGYTSSTMENHLSDVFWLAALLGVAIMAAGAAVGLIMGRSIVRPLTQLGAAVEKVSTGDLQNRIETVGDDEVGRIAGAFNAMVENLEFAYRELKSTISDLEGRTSDLQREVEERRRAAEALRVSEQRYRDLAEATFEGIGITENGIILEVNDQLATMAGYTTQELIGRPVIDIVAPESRPLVAANIKASTLGPYEHLCLRKDGTTFPVEVRSRTAKVSGRTLRVTAVRDVTEQKRSQKALQESEEKFSRAFYTNPDAVSLVRLSDGAFLDVNDGFVRFTGYARDAVIGQPSSSVSLWVNAADREAMVRALQSDGQVHSMEAPIRLRDGSTRYGLVSASILATGDEPCILSIMRDITDRKNAEESLRTAYDDLDKKVQQRTAELTEANHALRHSMEFLEKVVNVVGDPMFVKDRRHRWVLLNDSFCAFIGHPREGLLGKSDTDFFPREQADVFWQMDEVVFESGLENINEEQFTDGGGVVRTIMTRKNLYRDEKGDEFIVGIIRDVSMMKQQEHEIRKLNEELERRVTIRTYELQTANKELVKEIQERQRVEDELRKLTRAVEQSSSSVIITDVHGTIEYVNPKFVQVSGYSPEEVIGRNPRILKSGHTKPKEYAEMWKTILAGQEWHGEFRNRRKSGEHYWEYASLSPIKNERGEVTHFIAVKEDITERKSLEAQFRRAQRLEIIGTLAGGISHDLNNVLAPILMGIQVLRIKVHDEKGRQVLSTIEASANRGADIVKQVLTFARGSEGERTTIQMKHLLREIEEIVHETFPRSIRVEADIARDLLPVSGDATQLHQVVMNLCVNARDAMPDGGTLSIKAQNIELDEKGVATHLGAKKGRYILFSVSDTGMGIPQEHVEKIFDPFFTTKEIGKGTGLGLSTVQAIVRGHGGFVTVYSEPERGSQFKVYLPVGETQKSGSAGNAPAEMPHGHGECILVVDDELPVREITREVLTAYGYQVILARNGREALDQYEQNRHRIRAVITDMMMPQMDGATLIRELHRVDESVRILAVSGLANYETSDDLNIPNVHAFLTKPYKPEKLLWMLDTVLK